MLEIQTAGSLKPRITQRISFLAPPPMAGLGICHRPPRVLLPPPTHTNTYSIFGTTTSIASSSFSTTTTIGIRTRRRKMWCLASSTAKSVLDSSSAASDSPPDGERMLVFVPPHPLVKHWVSILRNVETPSAIFKSAIGELGRLLTYEATRDWLPTISGEIQAPMGVASVEFIDPREPVVVIPILRAGLGLVEHAPSILPAMKSYHLGLCRDEKTLQPSVYLNKLPEKLPPECRVLVFDPILATGGTIVAAIDLLKDCGVENKQIKIISALSAPPALQKLSTKFPGIKVYTGIIDPVVNDIGWIVPGMGDAGDRIFGTTHD